MVFGKMANVLNGLMKATSTLLIKEDLITLNFSIRVKAQRWSIETQLSVNLFPLTINSVISKGRLHSLELKLKAYNHKQLEEDENLIRRVVIMNANSNNINQIQIINVVSQY